MSERVIRLKQEKYQRLMVNLEKIEIGFIERKKEIEDLIKNPMIDRKNRKALEWELEKINTYLEESNAIAVVKKHGRKVYGK